MSPSPAAIPLEVERYIGASLISHHNHVKSKNGATRNEFFANQNAYRRSFVEDRYRRQHHQRCNLLADGWCGGIPIVSFGNQRRSCTPRQDEYNLARLAVHTQGAPLILTKSYNHRKNRSQRNQNDRKAENRPQNKPSSTTDTVSVASDESSTSNNSDNCLPRIIKPRKRRKKDRKLPLLDNSYNQENELSTDSSASPEINLANLVALNQFSFSNALFDLVPSDVPRGSFYDDFSETPKLHHSFDEIEEQEDGKDLNGNQSTSTCQCRYCDPSGQIWDVDTSCYSSMLTPPDRSNVFTYPGNDLDDFCLIRAVTSLRLDETATVRNPPPSQSSLRTLTPRDLEVSTEIVTSLNGHRDLEIKFFSTPSSAATTENSRSDIYVPKSDFGNG